LILVALLGLFASAATSAQVQNFSPVTREMLLNPSPDDWLMLSRTYDEQRFSPLNQINRQDVGQLRMVWVRGMAVMTGDGQSATTNLLRQVPTLAPPRGHNAIYVFALPDR
jgi:alcohol dehydrogenase (cytochrome c)